MSYPFRLRRRGGVSLFFGLALVLAEPTFNPAHAASAGNNNSVSGRFELDGAATAPAHIAAFRVRDRNHAQQWETYVILSGKPVQRESIVQAIDPYLALINDPAVLNEDSLALFVHDDGVVALNAHIGGVQYVDSSASVMGMPGSLVAQCDNNTASHVTCSVKTPRPVKPMGGGTWTLDVRFDSDVLSGPAGKPIDKSGGEPGRAFMQLVDALKGNSLDAILAGLSARAGEDYRADYNTPEENLGNAKSTLEMVLPKKPRVTGGEYLDDQRALLEVEGMPFEGMKALHLIEMTREDGRWVLSDWRQIGFLD